ncbi:MAG: HAD-IA family hydrolase, partial [Candidatus Altiarchaeota archaeon]|nr:HAD-IA family hydrolase [Candidatus Altiarchaeota archaeon]MBU4437895.1 HAD-IA family hydrolase [Candidatus Altiarchaeota archaeon]
EFLQKLKGDGMKLAIATGNERSFLDRTMDYLNLDGLFDLTLCAEDVENSKPAPDIVLKAVEFFQVDKGDALFVGDAKSDILAAKGAGVTSVAVLSGVLDKEGAEELKPDFIVDDILDIYSITVNK